MPAQEEYLRSIRLMHVVFCISCVALVVVSVWAVFADYDDEWREIQRIGYALSAQQIRDEQRDLDTKEYESEKSAVLKQIEAAHQSVSQRSDAIAKRQSELKVEQGKFDLHNRETKVARANRDVARANLGLLIRDGASTESPPYVAAKETFDRQQAKVAAMELELQDLEENLKGVKSQLAELTRERDEALAALKKLTASQDQLTKALNQVDPQDWLAATKWDVMEWPVIEGFNSHLKLNQIWLPKLRINYGGMGEVARFDRCITCHMNIDKTKPGNLPAFPHDSHGLSVDNAREMLQKDLEAAQAAAAAGTAHRPSARTYAHPFATHPNLDLFLTAASPHPMQTIGCTSCHEGQGSGTSFHNVQHMPNNPGIGQKWGEKYGWSYNHFWEYPMLPERISEAGCIKCHHNVTELGVHPKFGASAPKAYEGFQLLTTYGCFGCHEVNGYNAGKRIGPDIRLEPQTKEEADRIAADPTAVAGDYRKVGPGLRHFASKARPAFAEYWVKDPTQFHPKTRMPKFFHLTNQQDPTAEKLQPVEIAGIARYLDRYSEPLKTDDWGEYQPNAVRGKLLFSQRGCLACHEHEDFPDSKADFGPDLTHVHEKIRRDRQKTAILVADGEGTASREVALSKWLYTWVRDPSRHSERTKMPNTYLSAEGDGAARIDPAADIVAYLLQKPERDFSPTYKTKADQDKADADFEKTLGDLTRRFLRKTLSAKEVDKVLETGVYPRKPSEIKGDEIELAIDLAGIPASERDQKIFDARLTYVGRRTISRYGCYGCHDIAGYEKARPIGTPLQDWGRKDPSKLALEHIEEYLHHHGEPDRSSTAARVEETVKRAVGNSKASETDLSAAYFYGQLLSHGRAGFLWQKLRDPRSYDYELEETKDYDERLRMPKFPFDERQIESIANFVLGLTAEPPAEQFVYKPQGRAKARLDGEKLLSRFNCTACHMVDLPKVQRSIAAADYAVDASTDEAWEALMGSLESQALVPYIRGRDPAELRGVTLGAVDDFVKSLKASADAAPQRVAPADLMAVRNALRKEAGASPEQFNAAFNTLVQGLLFAPYDATKEHLPGLDLLMQVKKPRADQLTGAAEQVVSFHGLKVQSPNPDDPPEDQEFIYVNWEMHELGQKVVLAQEPIIVPAAKQAGVTPGRGGEFAMWLVDSLRGKDQGREAFDTALQAAPPILYMEGSKVQTPWLYRFLQNPDRLRYTTVLRMPQFNLSEKEAQTLADYFAAADGSEFPYQDVPERGPDYLAGREAATRESREAATYLDESFRVIDMQLCNGCHSVAGKAFNGNPKDPKVVRGPDLGRVSERLRPDWLALWMFKPGWITPYTSMPAPFPPAAINPDTGKPNDQNPNLFKGDEILQTFGARDALMNYHRLMEKQRPVTAAPPVPDAAQPNPGPPAPAEEK